MSKEFLPPFRKSKECLPFLFNNSKIQLPKILDLIFSGYNTENNDVKSVDIAFIFASGRAKDSVGQIGLICDALYIPEITLCLKNRCPSGYNLNVSSCLDIDMYEFLSNMYDYKERKRPHMILCATGDINIVVQSILQKYQDWGISIRPGPVSPNSDALASIDPDAAHFTAEMLPNAGCLIALTNPYCPDRLAIICGGIHCIGTVAALRLLYLYLSGEGDDFGNNRINPEIPGKIVLGRMKQYGMKIRKKENLIPQHEICNLDEADPFTIAE